MYTKPTIPRRSLFVTASALATGLVLSPRAFAAHGESDADVVAEWHDLTAATIAELKVSPPPTVNRAWAIAWLAAARAVKRVPHRIDDGDYRRAALASAVATALAELFPGRAEQLRESLAASLERIPDGQAKKRGTRNGAARARDMLDEREKDGLDPESVNAHFPVPETEPGIWRPTPDDYAPATLSGTRHARPFTLSSPDQFRPGPPPNLDSEQYRQEMAEVAEYGEKDSTTRTAEQTAIAQFWVAPSFKLYTSVLAEAVARHPGSIARRARLVALFHAAVIDAQIAACDAKYTAYLRWRPVTALRENGRPDWTPLHETPAHPDYPSNHNTYAAAAETVLTAEFGPRPLRPFTIESPEAPGAPRRYTRWRQLTDENIGARIWSGIHTRAADEAGAELGRDTARHALRHAGTLLSA